MVTRLFFVTSCIVYKKSGGVVCESCGQAELFCSYLRLRDLFGGDVIVDVREG